MKQTLMIKLDTSPEQYNALLETMHRFNEACNYIAVIAFSIMSANKIKLQQIVYHDVREKFGLSAQLAIRAIAKVAEAYKRDKSIKPEFREDGAIVYDQRILSWKGLEAVSILSLKGRLKIPVRIGEYQEARLDRIRGQADLILRDGIFYLAVVVEVPEPTKFDAVGTLGVDLGIVNLATDSDGETFSGKQVDEVRERNAKLRANLQGAGTKSAKRHLKKLSGKERRFHRDINHVISKKIAAKAKDTGKAVALENLEGISTSTTVRRAQRSRNHSWAFRQLRSFIEYKAALSGVPVILVNPRGTSHTCPVCGHNERANRPNRDTFRCVKCGFSGCADHTAAINIACRAAVNQPIVSGNFLLEHFCSPQGQTSNGGCMPPNLFRGN
jgi:IS605 OrfB family transposase